MTFRNLVAALVWIFALCLPSWAGTSGRRYENTFQLGERPTVVLNNTTLTGNVVVKAWGEAGVKILADIEAPRTDVECVQSAGTLIVSLRRQDSNATQPVHFEIWSPRDAALELSAFSGHVSVEGLEGRLKIRTVQGAIDIMNCAGKKVDALSTTNGSIMLRGPLSSPTVYTIYSGSGRIEVRLVKQASFTLHAVTHSGKIDLGGLRLREHHRGDRLVEGEYANGDSLLHLRTHSGTIELRME